MIIHDLSKFRNGSQWSIRYNPEAGLWEIVSHNGNKFGSMFTTRTLAELHLGNYLHTIESANNEENAKRKRKAV